MPVRSSAPTTGSMRCSRTWPRAHAKRGTPWNSDMNSSSTPCGDGRPPSGPSTPTTCRLRRSSTRSPPASTAPTAAGSSRPVRGGRPGARPPSRSTADRAAATAMSVAPDFHAGGPADDGNRVHDAVRAAAEGWSGEAIVQRFQPGLAASVSFLTGPRQSLPLLPATQCLSNDGRFHYQGGTLPLPADLARRALRLGERAMAAMPGALSQCPRLTGSMTPGSYNHLTLPTTYPV